MVAPTIHKEVKASKMAGPDKKTNLLILCFLGKTSAPDGRYAAIGDTKSAKGPTAIRVRVFVAAIRFT